MLLKLLPQMLVDGLQLGFVYAIVALGYTMVYGVLHFINFANAEIFMCGAFIGAEVLIALLGAAAGGGWTVFAFAVALLAALVLTGLLGVFIERVAYRPLRSAPRLVPLISAFGVSYFAGLRARGRDVRAQQLLSDAAVDLQAGIRAERIHEGHRPRHSDRRRVPCGAGHPVYVHPPHEGRQRDPLRVAEPDDERAARYPRKQDHHDDVFRRARRWAALPGRCSPSSMA